MKKKIAKTPENSVVPPVPPFPAADPAKPANTLQPIVGIGASAGGLHALEEFFSAVPARTGLTFVVIQHLDPNKESMLVQLLQRACHLPVLQITDRCLVKPDHVYVAPPGYEVTLLHGVLHLLRPALSPARHLAIDFFFRSLAMDQGANAAGVILSGVGSDGTLGLRALKENAGGAFVQSPSTSEFDSMPRYAIASEMADIVAPAAELPEKILAYFAHPLLFVKTGVQRVAQLESTLEKVLILVRAQTGHDFSLYKRSTVFRRIQRRMAIHQIEAVDQYLAFVRNNPHEAELLFKELLIGVTSFFRDPAVWDALRDDVIPALLARQSADAVLRAWVAACCTGEEAYTLAMVFTEVVSEMDEGKRCALQIFATDLENDAVIKARTGIYPENIVVDVSPERLKRFFTKVPNGYRINKDIRSMVVFAEQSIASDPPFGKLSILSCRNLLIYLEPELQQRLIPLFHRSLNPEGILVLGNAETVAHNPGLFTAINGKLRIYRKLESGLPVNRNGFGFVHNGTHAEMMAALDFPLRSNTKPANLQVLADQLLLKRYAPAAVLVSAGGDIVYFSGRTGKYLQPPAGKANLNLFAMVHSGMAQPLTELFYRAEREQTAKVVEEVLYEVDEQIHRVRINIDYITEPDGLKGLLMVIFSELPASAAGKKRARPSGNVADARIQELMHQLIQARNEHQSTRDEMQTAQEELKSANEEHQSANEELTTSREELHSINQELQTVNAELQAQVDALSRASDDMENLLNSTDVATLFLDQSLNVRRFTPRTLSVIKLIPGDAGRPITDLVSDLHYDALADDAREVLRTLMFTEKEVSASNNRWFMVRTKPYRTQDNRIDGVVITFSDISVAKSLEASLRESQKNVDLTPRSR